MADGRRLDFDVVPTENGDEANLFVLAQGSQLVGHLNRQLAGRSDDQGLRHTLARLNQLEYWNAKGCRFAAAGLGQADDVPPGESKRNGFGLNGCRLFESHFPNRSKNGR